ncbi:MAG: 16S rRNA (uracil(1498)-N(3))-methyltransferase [Bacteroidota bacterium]
MNLFYTPNIIEPITTLTEEESKHIIRVLRKSVGDMVFFTDGLGYNYKCIIIEGSPKKCTIEILEKKLGEDNRNYKLHIAIAPTKNIARYEWFLEKSTEIGIDTITPIICYNSERRDIKPERLNKVITSAMKQSLKSFHPILNDKTSFKTMIVTPFEGEKFIAYIDNEVTLELAKAHSPDKDTLILIGPEGDFSKQEVDEAKAAGFIPVRLGKSRLRTETAGIVACHTVALNNQ